MLSIVEYINKNGLDKAISEFNLVCKEYEHKVLLKYNQIESNMSLSEVQDCRGIILEKHLHYGTCLSEPFSLRK